MSDMEELGGLWLKTSQKSGKKFMSGRLTIGGEQIDVLVFKNEHKQEGERTPDYRMYRSQPREQQDSPRRNDMDSLDDEIPF